VPDVVGNKLFKSYLPIFNEVFLRDTSNSCHKPFYVFNQNIISCNQHFFLWRCLLLSLPLNQLMLLSWILLIQVLSTHLMTGSFSTASSVWSCKLIALSLVVGLRCIGWRRWHAASCLSCSHWSITITRVAATKGYAGFVASSKLKGWRLLLFTGGGIVQSAARLHRII